VLTGILLARTLGPRGRGELAAAILWPTLIMTLGTLGMTEAITYHTARRSASLRALFGTSASMAVSPSSGTGRGGNHKHGHRWARAT